MIRLAEDQVKIGRVVVVALIAAAALATLAGCGGQSNQSARIAAQIGAAAKCSQTRYALENRVTNAKTPIYDCWRGPTRMCVTEQGGLAHDETTIVRFAFADSLNGRPACLNG